MVEFRSDWPVELEGVSQSVYFASIVFETICFFIVLLLVIFSIRRVIQRKRMAAYFIAGLYTCFLIGLAMTILAKVNVLFFDQSFIIGRAYEKFSLVAILLSLNFLFLFDLEIFTMFEKEQKLKYFLPIFLLSVIFGLNEVIRLYDQTTLALLGFYILFGLFLFGYHIYHAQRLMRRQERKLEKYGMLAILLQGVFFLIYLMAVVFSSLFILLDLLPPFNLLYFFSWTFLISALLFSYLGFFLPPWFRNWVDRRGRSVVES